MASVAAAAEGDGGTATVPVEPALAVERSTTTVVGGEGLTVVAVAVCAVLTVVLGVLPSPVLDAIAGVSLLLP